MFSTFSEEKMFSSFFKRHFSQNFCYYMMMRTSSFYTAFLVRFLFIVWVGLENFWERKCFFWESYNSWFGAPRAPWAPVAPGAIGEYFYLSRKKASCSIFSFFVQLYSNHGVLCKIIAQEYLCVTQSCAARKYDMDPMICIRKR